VAYWKVMIRRVIADHIVLPVKNLTASEKFYTTVFDAIGFSRLSVTSETVAFGVDGCDDFAIREGAVAPVHVAIACDSAAAVDAFFEAAVAAGASIDTPPQIHHEYSAGYYAAFVYDPNGHSIEAVFHADADYMEAGDVF
jgi:predicted lactoylglutathione lyase